MKIEQRGAGPAVVISPVGRLEGVGAPDLEASVCAVAGRGDSRVVLDCARVTCISSAGLRAVLAGATTCRHLGGRLAIAAAGSAPGPASVRKRIGSTKVH